MHFPNVFRYVEAAEHAFLRSLGVELYDFAHGGWPRAHVECDYKQPLRAGDQIEVQLNLEKVGGASLTWQFELVNSSGVVAASGTMVTVRVDAHGRPQEIESSVRDRLAH
jgi:acyl-CoA thioesterase FadM